MFYVLMSFLGGEKCGIEITEYIRAKTRGRVSLGPGTLYTILAKFESEKMIEETEVVGRKRTYKLTQKGKDAYYAELDRLRQCIADAEEV